MYYKLEVLKISNDFFCLDSLSVQSSLNSILLLLSREQKATIEVKFMQ